MGRDDDGFNLDDMMEILGDSAPGRVSLASISASPPLPPPPAPVARPTPTPARAPLPVLDPEEGLTAEERALLRDYEEDRKKKSQMEEQAKRVREQLAVREQEARRIIEEYERQAASASPPPPRRLDDIGNDENAAFCALLEGSRVVMFSYLVPRIGAKNAVSMLAKSVEKARSRAPLALKDANWRADGSLREDGSVDPDRLLKNAAALAPETRVADYLAGLRELVDLRLRAVEAGLGLKARFELAGRLLATRSDPANRGVPQAWLAAFYEGVLV